MLSVYQLRWSYGTTLRMSILVLTHESARWLQNLGLADGLVRLSWRQSIQVWDSGISIIHSVLKLLLINDLCICVKVLIELDLHAWTSGTVYWVLFNFSLLFHLGLIILHVLFVCIPKVESDSHGWSVLLELAGCSNEFGSAAIDVLSVWRWEWLNVLLLILKLTARSKHTLSSFLSKHSLT